MNKKDQQFFMDSYSLEHTKRYSMYPVIHQESVATHSYFVTLGVLMLSNYYAFDVDEAIKIAICHDLPEMKISDVNHKVKKDFPAVSDALKLAEQEVILTLPTQVKNYCTLYGEDTPEALVVHYADALQCLQYAVNEIDLGNKGYMLKVHSDSLKRIKRIKVKLVKYGI